MINNQKFLIFLSKFAEVYPIGRIKYALEPLLLKLRWPLVTIF